MARYTTPPPPLSSHGRDRPEPPSRRQTEPRVDLTRRPLAGACAARALTFPARDTHAPPHAAAGISQIPETLLLPSFTPLFPALAPSKVDKSNSHLMARMGSFSN